MRLIAAAHGALIWLALCTASSAASAFERQWHVGAAAGVSDGQGLELSPAVGVYGAYGLSDVFDLRLEVTARGYHLGSEQNPNQLAAMLGLTYKLDVLRWIPWAGVYAGYQGLDAAPRAGLSNRRNDVALGLGAGLDYAVSRGFALGFTWRGDEALSGGDAATFEALLRAELQWGF